MKFEIRSLCLFVALVAAFAGVTSPTIADPMPHGKILYVDTSEEGKTYLAVINPDGSGKTRITPPFANIVFPRYSAAAGKIGFTHKKPDMSSEVYLLDVDGKKLERVLTGVSLEGFSPDGKSMLYTTCDMNSSLNVYNFASKKSVRISEKYRVTAADWSPNGEWIAASILTDAGTNDLLVISTIAQGIERLTNTPDIDESFPTWASDSRHLAFINNERGMNYIDYLDIVTKKIETPNIPGMYPVFTPDSEFLTFESGRKVAFIQRNGLNPRLVAQGRTPSWIR